MNEHDDICESFNRLLWHDSKLRAFRIVRRVDTDDLLLDVEVGGISGTDLTPATVTLRDVAFLFCDVDLQAKRECSDDISSARCTAQSELISKIVNERLKLTPDALSGYRHFSFYLIPPGGTVDVIAASFTIARSDTQS